MSEKVDIQWSDLKFNYIKTDKRFIARNIDGQWDSGVLVSDDYLLIHEGSTCLHYGQQCFEGLKAYSAQDGRILLFRPDENARRIALSAEAIMMLPVPQELFLRAVFDVVRANRRWVPPYGYGASFYIRPYQIGVGSNIGVKPAPEYIFGVFGLPVGPYYVKFDPVDFVTTDYDRAASNGTGAAKVGGNYAASMKAHDQAVKAGFRDCIYLDPATHTKIEEAGAANFFAITPDNVFVTPKSPSILPSITKKSLIHIAQEYLNMEVIERDILVTELGEFTEAGACGTAAVITPIGSINHKDKRYSFHDDGKSVGPVIQKLYDILTQIQVGEHPAPDGWVWELD